jgi:hypothetical protein
MNRLWTNHSTSNLSTAKDQPRIATNLSVPRFSQHKGNPLVFQANGLVFVHGLFARSADEYFEKNLKRYGAMVVGNRSCSEECSAPVWTWAESYIEICNVTPSQGESCPFLHNSTLLVSEVVFPGLEEKEERVC